MTTEEQLQQIIRDSMRPTQAISGTIDEFNGTVVCFTKSFSQTTITKMSFHNSAAYQLTVMRYNNGSNTLSQLFSYAVGAGNRLEDTEVYLLYEGDYLFFLSDVVGTTYDIQYTSAALVATDQQYLLRSSRPGSNVRPDYTLTEEDSPRI